MGSIEVTVRKALASQDDLKARREHCSVDARLLDAIGVALGEQVRIQRTPTELALFTVSECREEDDPSVVRVGLIGRRRLDKDGEFRAVMTVPAAEPSLSDTDAEDRGELVERLGDGVDHGLIVLAPHGGDIERYTDEQAERVAAALSAFGVRSWRCKGWRARREDDTGGAFDCWHITSTDLAPASFPKLGSVAGRGFRYAVAFHGFEESDVLIGGAAPAGLKEEVRHAIARKLEGSGITVRVATPEDHYGGDDECNLVNRLTTGGVGGVQVEQGLTARRDHGAAIADAVATVFGRKLRPRRPPWQEPLVDAVEWVRGAARRGIEWVRRRFG